MAVTALYRFPVTSMLGESLRTCTIDAGGVLGDRAYAVIDVETGAVASAKVPKRWAALLDFSARYVAEPVAGDPAPPVEITFPDGSVLRSDDPGLDEALSAVFDRPVHLASTRPDGSSFEELWPDIDGPSTWPSCTSSPTPPSTTCASSPPTPPSTCAATGPTSSSTATTTRDSPRTGGPAAGSPSGTVRS
jgi:hypothetical protein